MYFNKYVTVRVPLYTCSECFLAEYFKYKTYWFLKPTVFLHWHISYTQFFLPSLIALDRFMVIVIGPPIVKVINILKAE